jgi:hypothetical protein
VVTLDLIECEDFVWEAGVGHTTDEEELAQAESV